MDYYDYGPRVALERPIVLTGFMGAGVSHTGHALSSVLGLPYIELDRRIEHHAGMSLAQLQLSRGERARRDLEATLLVDAVAERPMGVIALGDGALLRADSLAWVTSKACLVYLERPEDYLFTQIARELGEQPARYPELAARAGTADETHLRTMLGERKPGYQAAAHHIPAAELHPSRVSELVRACLSLADD